MVATETEAAPQAARFTTVAEAIRQTGLSRDRIRELVRRRAIGTLRLPGAWPLLDLSELRALIADSIDPADRPGDNP